MEIVLVLIIGLAVACAVLLLGRVLVGSGSVSEQLHQPEGSISANASAVAAGDPVENTVDETQTARATELPSDDRNNKAPKKARKPSVARSREDVTKAPRRPRERKTKEATAPGAHVHDAEIEVSEGPKPPRGGMVQ
jgi:hypothetical protein